MDINRDPELTFRGSMGRDFTMASESFVGHSHQAVPLHPRVSRPRSSQCSSASSALSPHLSTPHPHTVVARAASRMSRGLPHAHSTSWWVGVLSVFKHLSNPKLPKEINLWPKLDSTVKLIQHRVVQSHDHSQLEGSAGRPTMSSRHGRPGPVVGLHSAGTAPLPG